MLGSQCEKRRNKQCAEVPSEREDDKRQSIAPPWAARMNISAEGREGEKEVGGWADRRRMVRETR